MLSSVKSALRIKVDAFDNDIQDLIDSALADLLLSGINNFKESDPLIKRAVILYNKSHFGLNNEDSEKYMKSYESLKTHLALSQEYTEVVG